MTAPSSLKSSYPVADLVVLWRPTICLVTKERDGVEEKKSMHVAVHVMTLALIVPTLVALTKSKAASVYRSSATKSLIGVLLGFVVDSLTLLPKPLLLFHLVASCPLPTSCPCPLLLVHNSLISLFHAKYSLSLSPSLTPPALVRIDPSPLILQAGCGVKRVSTKSGNHCP